MREAYGFLCSNYEEGDEIILIGFSRGAFTARSIGALIHDVGLLNYKGMEDFYNIFKDWEKQDPSLTFSYRGPDGQLHEGLTWEHYEPRTSYKKSSYAECLEEVRQLSQWLHSFSNSILVRRNQTKHQDQGHRMLRHSWCSWHSRGAHLSADQELVSMGGEATAIQFRQPGSAA